MSKFNYDKMTSLSAKLLDKFGSTVFVETPDSTLHKGFGVFDTYTTQDRPASLTEENALKFYLDGSIDESPQLGDYLLSGDQVWIITQVDYIQPGGVLIMYELGVKL